MDRLSNIRHSVIEDAAEDLEATAENYRRTAASSAPEIRHRWLDQAERYERMAATVRGAVAAIEAAYPSVLAAMENPGNLAAVMSAESILRAALDSLGGQS